MALTFVVGTAADVFGPDLGQAIDAALSTPAGEEAYRSDPVDAAGWRALQGAVMRALDAAPQIATVDAYQAVYMPGASEVRQVPVANLADPMQVGSLEALLAELRAFAAEASLPIDDVELMRLFAQLLEGDEVNLELETYVQLMLSAKQAAVRGQALWVVV
ncbi:MAG TPA: hypothetical protein VND45_00925 [Thermoanaerobaculia bacterium]|nr:hypothetical protein [Thermoanaerobaculia bacterium]